MYSIKSIFSPENLSPGVKLGGESLFEHTVLNSELST